MKIRILGGGWYGCSIALGLIKDGHDVELHETADKLFAGASGSNPARLHLGFHYPRSGATQRACREHQEEFMQRYGHLVASVPMNLYAIASHASLVDYQSYVDTFKYMVDLIEVDPARYGLRNVEGAILTGEKHIIIDSARAWFMKQLDERVIFKMPHGVIDDPDYDMSIDCTFCANDATGIDRFEPCVTGIIAGPTDMAVTIMDGPFGSIYPWNESRGLLSLTSASLTPLSKECKTHEEARAMLLEMTPEKIEMRCALMIEQMAIYWPACRSRFQFVEGRLAVRAMPRSAADSRLVDVARVGKRALRVRAGKIDAVFHAERQIKEIIYETKSLGVPLQ